MRPANTWDRPHNRLVIGHQMRRKLIDALLHFLYFVLLKLEVSGTENVPPDGPLILMINHVDALDPFIVVGVFLRPRF